MSDEKKLTLSNRSKLGLSKGVETGQVRQSFSHGRSKAVVVERKKRRILKPGTPVVTEQEEKQKKKPANIPAPAQREEAENLTNRERDVRAEALKGAIRRAEEERMRAAEEKRLREEKERLDALSEQEKKSSRQEKEEAEAEAKRKAEEDAKRMAEKVAREKAEEAARLLLAEDESKAVKAKKAHPDHKVDAVSRAPEREEKEKEEKAPRPRRVEERRRSGKLTVNTLSLDEDGEESRPRSLAAFKRAQAKKKAANKGSGGGQKKVREVTIPEVITVQELANRMAEKASAVIKTLMNMDVMATINDNLDPDTAELVVQEFGHMVKRVSAADVEIGLIGEDDDTENLVPRPPVITVMGHVDHGKTSLLDAIRKADVVSGEAGGITQHIGAYQITTKSGQKATFIDTPGHEAFTQMRARGASVTDLVILVVAADDGIMPQTVEAINHAKAAEVPIIVAINKMDRDGADADRVRQELLQHEIIVEKLSGDVLDVEVSALKKTGLDKLEDAILLQAELLELKANPDRSAEGIVIEAELDKGRGSVATVLIKRGTLNVGDIVVAGTEWGRVKALADDRGQQIKKALPSQPVEILGLGSTPSAGDVFSVVENEARAREVTGYRKAQIGKHKGAAPVSLENMFSAMKEAQAKEIPIVVKGDVQGSVEAITSAIDKLGTDEIRTLVLHSGVGGITESDITLAQASGAPVIGFNVRANRQARDAAERDGVAIKYYSVIYDLVDDIRAAMIGELGPAYDEKILGVAEIRDVFAAGKTGKAAGCLVIDGVVRRDAKARLLRDDVVIYEGDLSSLRRFKDDVKEVKAGTECGMAFENYQDIKTGDQIEVFELIERERTL